MKVLSVIIIIICMTIPISSEIITINNRDWIPLYSEDFEDGAEDWEHYDATGVSDWNEFWHLSDTGAYSGNSWWMGDEELGGYIDNRYLVLDTPEFILAEDSPELNFMFSLSCEDIGGDPPYNAWDGANVRISTNGGNTWTPIEGTPEYNGTSFYSFGYVFDEGIGVPGWASNTEWVNWTAANFDLSEYAGESVMLRFAFASDVAYNTLDDPDMFGIRLDNIEVDTIDGIFLSNGDGAAGDEQMQPGYGNIITGDLWHIYEDTSAPSPDQAIGCFADSSGTYLPGMLDYIITPVIFLPESGIYRWDVNFKMLLEQNTIFPESDYPIVRIQTQIPGEAWSYWNDISYWATWMWDNDYPEWTLFSETWPESSNISEYAGRNIRIRFGLHSNDSNEPVPGGIMLDDFYIFEEYFAGPPPENLTAEVNDFLQVVLNWDALENERDFTGYNIWRSDISGEDYEMLGIIDPMDEPFYTDFYPDIYWNHYVVTGIFDGEDGEQSNEASAYVISEDDLDLGYDDGSCEMGLNVGTANFMGVKFSPSYPTERMLYHLSLYIETMDSGQFVFRIYDEENGVPAEQLAQFNVTPGDLVQGWNTLDIPEENWENLHFTAGSFYITIFEMAHLSAIGVDTDSYGHSYTGNSPEELQEYTAGNIMIRAIMTGGPEQNNDEDIIHSQNLNVYPNPFNPETAIDYYLDKEVDVNISIYNIKGQKVEVLVDKLQGSGHHQVIWSAEKYAGGIYLLNYRSENRQETKKLIYLK
ncbi:MAG: T9SS type A sorting domain-containing protein [Candidatus Cloacimonetes bacterium]|nr:T9SS type A sorting domain-containing protein [Candidatus Cloacimonadota bacterium]